MGDDGIVAGHPELRVVRSELGRGLFAARWDESTGLVELYEDVACALLERRRRGFGAGACIVVEAKKGL